MNTESPASPENDANLSGLGRALFDTGSSKSSGPWVPPTAEELHAILPQYEIVKTLGRGGMGAVYMGTQTALDRPVAIKILSSALEDSDAGFVERFKNEARAMAKLKHPGIVLVYDFGETTGGLLYIVMEYVAGTDVARMIAAQGRLHTEHAMAITAHVCDALAYAHERGIIHRDIKPANVMVGHDGNVKVADFGLAKVNVGGQTLGLTQSGMAMGTLHFMAPEAMMLGTAVDHRADIYAVGVMLYQMLTGKLPHGMFKLPSQVVPGLDPRFDGVVRKALMEDRKARYQSAREMRADLDSMLTQPVMKAEPASSKSAQASPVLSKGPLLQQKAASLGYQPKNTELPDTAKARTNRGWLWGALAALAAGAAVVWSLQSSSAPKSPSAIPPVPAASVAPKPPNSTPSVSVVAPLRPPSPPAQTTTPAVSPPASTVSPKVTSSAASQAPIPSRKPETSPTLPKANADGSRTFIDLLTLPSVDSGALSGRWRTVGTGLEVLRESSTSNAVTLAFPCSVTWPSYDYEVEFTLTAEEVGAITLHAPTPSKRVICYLQSYPKGQIYYGFNGLDGKVIRENPAAATALPLTLKAGVKYTTKVEVRPGRLRVFMDGRQIVDWSGDLNRFDHDQGFRYSQNSPALGVFGGGVIFNKATVTQKSETTAVATSSILTPPQIPTWIDNKGRSLKAAFNGISGQNVILGVAGADKPFPLKNLSPASQQQAQELQKTFVPSSGTTPATTVLASVTAAAPAALKSTQIAIDLSLEDNRTGLIFINLERNKSTLRKTSPGKNITVECAGLQDGKHLLYFWCAGHAPQWVRLEMELGKPKTNHFQVTMYRLRYVVIRSVFNTQGGRELTGPAVKQLRQAYTHWTEPRFTSGTDWQIWQAGSDDTRNPMFGDTPWLQPHRYSKGYGFIKSAENYVAMLMAPDTGYRGQEFKAEKGLTLYFHQNGNGGSNVGYGKLIVEDVTETPPPGVEVLAAKP